MIPLRAAARLQLQAAFSFDDAAAQVPYYAALGVSHLYLSPIGSAVPGSTHGYDNIDPGTVNPELGGEAGLLRLSRAARAHGMGLLLDIVPNHMAAHSANPWWWDVLRHGRRSRHAGWFDIDWRAPGCDGKLLLPVLDRPFARALREGLLRVLDVDGELQLAHHDQRFPLEAHGATIPADDLARAAWLRALEEDARAGGGQLRRLVERQPYRLAWWCVGSDLLNYRRFLDIASLAALRVELPAVFDAVHALPLRLAAAGHVDGVRIDHIDGLADPRQYLRRLRAGLDAAGRQRGLPAGRLALYVEKVLAPGEELPPDWRCDGTTGYDFMDQVGGWLHAAAGRASLVSAWRRISGRTGDFGEEVRQAREEMLRGPLQAEFMRAMAALSALARREPDARDFSPQMLARGLATLLRGWPGYRTSAGRAGLTLADREGLETGARSACEGMPESVRATVAALLPWLRGDEGAQPGQAALRRIARRRVEQLATALNAKAVEDTAYYRHGVLLSRNEVGSLPDPAHFALDAEGFHAACRARAARHPRALLTTATHDHKRGEDVRARLAVLSERPRWWTAQVRRFEALAEGCGIDALYGGDRWMLWQTLVASWSPTLRPDAGEALSDYAGRIVQWQRKALREAKLFTHWIDPAAEYERAAQAGVERLLCSPAGASLRRALWRAAEAIGPAGACNGLAQVALRLTVPGVPDLYQGCEGWDLSLVDPDNRRPVDYAQRHAWLQDGRGWEALLRDWRDGAVKARLVARLLQLRRDHPGLFSAGDYQPLSISRVAGVHVLAFQRRHGGQTLVVAIARAAEAESGIDATLSVPARVWSEAGMALPPGRHRDVLGEDELAVPRDCHVAASRVFARGPVAVLLSI